jgi:hypothetical protein
MLQDLGNNTLPVLTKGLVAYLRTGPRWFLKKLGPTLDHGIEDCLPAITHSTMVLRDAVYPHAWADEIVSPLPDGHLEELSDRGHEALISSGEPGTRQD